MILSVCVAANAQSSNPEAHCAEVVSELKQSSVNSATIAELCETIRKANHLPSDAEYVVSLLTQRKQVTEAQAVVDASYLPLKKLYGKPGEDPNRSRNLEKFAAIFSKSHYDAQADQVFVKWVQSNEQSFGSKSPKTAAALLKAAQYFAQEKELDSSKAYLARANQILSTLPAKDAAEALPSLTSIAYLYKRSSGSDSTDAENILRLQISREHQIRSPKERKDTVFCLAELTTQQQLAALYVEQKRYADARKVILTVLDCLVSNLPDAKKPYADDIRRLVDQLGVSHRLGEIDQILDAMATTDYDGSRNIVDTLTERAMANAAAELCDRERENHYAEQIISIEKDRLNSTNNLGPNFLIAAYKDYALRLENQRLRDRAAQQRAEADKVAKDWQERRRNHN